MNKISILLPVYNRKKLLYNTLESYNFFYKNNKNLEIIIVDDCSNDENRFDTVSDNFLELNIKHIRINQKLGFNPSLAYNVAARQATGDIFVLTSPETFHTQNFLEACNNFEKFKENDYYLFSVFCTVDQSINNILENESINAIDKIYFIENIKYKFCLNLGCNGYSFNNNYGSWYLHEVYRNTNLNFFTAMSKKIYYEVCGFNQAYMQGTGYDDLDFLDRITPYLKNYVWHDVCAIHINHSLAAEIDQNSNYELYSLKQKYLKNDLWGII